MFEFLGEENNDSISFRLFIENEILSALLCPYDILVCDNTAIHEKGYNCDISDFLWNLLELDGEPLRILLLPLPTRSPELNPIEIVWSVLFQRLRIISGELHLHTNHAAAHYAEVVMQGIGFDLINRIYMHCGY